MARQTASVTKVKSRIKKKPVKSSAPRLVGVIGLGLLGRGIAACLLAHGHRVIAYTRSQETRQAAHKHFHHALKEMVDRAGYPRRILATWKDRYQDAYELADMAPCDFVIESIFEDMQAKYETYEQIEAVLGPDVPIASNTSAIPITLIQSRSRHPHRFVGMHWAEPAHATRFLEIIKGKKTDEKTFQTAVTLAYSLGKEPSLVRKDIRGFITNRLMYAMVREALHLLEKGVADAETIDRSFRNDMGWWAAIAGPFRWMDMTGLTSYYAVAKDLFPQLSNAKTVSPAMKKLIDSGARGFKNGRGFFRYSPEEAHHWEKVWYDFTWQVRELAQKYVPATPDGYTNPLGQKKRRKSNK